MRKLELDPVEATGTLVPCAFGELQGLAPGRRSRLELVELDVVRDEPEDVAEEAQPALPPPLAYSEEELQAALAVAHRDAAAAAERAVRQELERSSRQRQAAALEVIAGHLAEIAASERGRVEAASRTVADLAIAIARAIVPCALDHTPLADVGGMLHEVVRRLAGEPVLELRLPEDLVEPGRGLLEEVAAAMEFPGRLEVASEPGLSPGDARLLWRHGQAERRLGVIAHEAEALARAWLQVPTPDLDVASAAPTTLEGKEDDHEH